MLKISWNRDRLSASTNSGKYYVLGKLDYPSIEPTILQDRIAIRDYALSIYDRSRAQNVLAKRKPKNYILGISGSGHDSAAVLLNQMSLVSALEEERITRTKHDSSQFPTYAILEILRINQLHWDDIDCIAIGWNYNDYIDLPHTTSRMRRFFQQIDREYANRNNIRPEHVQRRTVPERTLKRYQPRAVNTFINQICNLTGSKHIPDVSFVHHHLAHAASAYFPSKLPEPVLIITLDGYGENTTTSIWSGNNARIRHIKSIKVPHSLGWAYCSMTEYLGFKPLSGEGEVMGFAAYGAPRSEEESRRVDMLRALMKDFIYINQADGTFGINTDWIYYGIFPWGETSRVSQAMINRISAIVPRSFAPCNDINPDSPNDRGAANLAYVFQERIEEALLNLARAYLIQLKEKDKTESLALAGGTALNINAIGRLISEGIISVDRLFIPPAAGDAGTAHGAAMLLAQSTYGKDPRFRMRRADYGPKYSDDAISNVIKENGLIEGEDYRVLQSDDDIAISVANLLVNNQSVAWYQGGSEFGPRALGHRSILLNIQDPMTNGIANKIKRRQPWRPFAISINYETAGKYFQYISDAEIPFMNIRLPIKKLELSNILSGYHYADSSTRPQTVKEQDNPLFYKLLKVLGDMIGIPAVVNTSFNRREPLVNTPEEALNTYYYMNCLDVLCIGHYLILNRKNIIPTIRSFDDESLTHDLFISASKSRETTKWDAVFKQAIQWLGRGANIKAVIVKRNIEKIELEWPLIKEFFDDTIGPLIHNYLAKAIIREALLEGPSDVYIGSTHQLYCPIVSDRIAAAVTTYQKYQNDPSINKGISSIYSLTAFKAVETI